MKKHLIIIAAICSACMSSCQKSSETGVADPIRVEVIAVSPSNITSNRTFTGTMKESAGTDISFTVGGRLQSVCVEEGQKVSKGALIATIDPTDLQNAYQMAKATENDAQDAHDRMKKLHDSNSLPEMQWVQAQNALKTAQSATAIARHGLAQTKVYSPTSGYISSKSAEPGQAAVPGLPIARVVTIDPIYALISVPEGDISHVEEGQAATVTVGAIGGGIMQGKVKERGVQADMLSRTYQVKIEVPNPDGKALPGMICEAILENAKPDSVIVLPENAVLVDGTNNRYVWLAKKGKAQKRVVQTGPLANNGISILSGLEEGDSVITAGQQKVSEGSSIQILGK